MKSKINFTDKSAKISSCGLYRYELRRVWDDTLPPYVSGMLNPSTADGEVDDRTILTNCKRANALGYGSLVVWNLGAGRATKPKQWKLMKDPIGPENDDFIFRILTECKTRNGIAVAGWGNDGFFMQRSEQVMAIAKNVGISFHCLKINKSGQPQHPLYVADDQPLIEWRT